MKRSKNAVGIRFQGKVLKKELGLGPKTETEKALEEFGEKLSEQRIPGDSGPAAESGVFGHLAPTAPGGSGGMIVLDNKTMEDVMMDYKHQVRKHQRNLKADSAGMRFDPVTKTYY